LVPITPDVYPWLAVADLFVCASDVSRCRARFSRRWRFELPVVSTDAFGIAGLIKDGRTGWLTQREPRGSGRVLDSALRLSPDERREVGVRRGSMSWSGRALSTDAFSGGFWRPSLTIDKRAGARVLGRRARRLAPAGGLPGPGPDASVSSLCRGPRRAAPGVRAAPLNLSARQRQTVEQPAAKVRPKMTPTVSGHSRVRLNGRQLATMETTRSRSDSMSPRRLPAESFATCARGSAEEARDVRERGAVLLEAQQQLPVRPRT